MLFKSVIICLCRDISIFYICANCNLPAYRFCSRKIFRFLRLILCMYKETAIFSLFLEVFAFCRKSCVSCKLSTLFILFSYALSFFFIAHWCRAFIALFFVLKLERALNFLFVPTPLLFSS